MLAVHLIKTYCLPMLLYSCEIWAARPVDMRSVDVSWNNAFRKIFNVVGETALSRCSSTAPVLLQFYCIKRLCTVGLSSDLKALYKFVTVIISIWSAVIM